MFSQSTYENLDGGTSGAKAFFTIAWDNFDKTYTWSYKGFDYRCHCTGYRFIATQDQKAKSAMLDWQGRVNNELSNYDAVNFADYKKKYQEAQKTEKEEKKKEREELAKETKKYAEEGKDAKGNDTYQSLFKQIDELKANMSKPLELKQKDMKEIMEKVEAKNKEQIDKINQQIELKNDEITKLAEQVTGAQKAGNKQLENKLLALIKSKQGEMVGLSNQKNELPQKPDLEEYFQLSGEKTPRFNFKSKRFWIFSGIALVLLIAIILLIWWIIGKVRSYFSSNH